MVSCKTLIKEEKRRKIKIEAEERIKSRMSLKAYPKDVSKDDLISMYVAVKERNIWHNTHEYFRTGEGRVRRYSFSTKDALDALYPETDANRARRVLNFLEDIDLIYKCATWLEGVRGNCYIIYPKNGKLFFPEYPQPKRKFKKYSTEDYRRTKKGEHFRDKFVPFNPEYKDNRVYFLQAENGMIKIGTSTEIYERINTLRTASPCSFVKLSIMPGDMSVEKRLHKKFAVCRRQGEWFVKSQDIDEYISNNAITVNFNFNPKIDYAKKADELFWEDFESFVP
jgi:hypothetical protein